MSCQQTRPISSSRQHRISTQVGMQHHINLLSSLIISFYILTISFCATCFQKVTLCPHNIYFQTLHSVCLSNLGIFLQKKPLNFYFKTSNHFRDEVIRLVINTRLITTLKNVDMFKIIEFYWIMHSAFCGWTHFKNFITRCLEDAFICGAQFSKWQLVQNVAKCKY